MAGNLKLLPQGERLLSGKLNSLLSDVATTMNVNTPPSASKLPTYVEIDYGTDDAEVVRIIDVSGNVCTIERGVNDGGVGKEHQANANYKQKLTHQFATLITQAVENGWLTEDSSYAYAQVSTSSFKVTASGVDRTGLYSAGRRIRLNGSIVVTISSSSYSNPDTTVTVKETTVPASITSVELEIGPKGSFRQVATGAEINTGTDDTKIVTAKALADSDVAFLSDIDPVPVKATGAEINTGTDDAKFATPKAIADSNLAFIADIPVKATGAEVTTGTDDAKFATPKALADAGVNTRLKSKVITATRDLTAASGNVAYTGVGFTPTAIIALTYVDGAQGMNIGVSDSGKTDNNMLRAASGLFTTQACLITHESATGNLQNGVVNSYDADGFTISWTKISSPTGTLQMIFLCLR